MERLKRTFSTRSVSHPLLMRRLQAVGHGGGYRVGSWLCGANNPGRELIINPVTD